MLFVPHLTVDLRRMMYRNLHIPRDKIYTDGITAACDKREWYYESSVYQIAYHSLG